MPLNTEEILARLDRLEQAVGLSPRCEHVYSQDVEVGSLIRVKGLWRRAIKIERLGGSITFTLMPTHTLDENTTHRVPVRVPVEVKVP